MSFYCLRCAECCSAMGDVHTLVGNPRAGHCVVVNRYTGERTTVAVDPDKAGLLVAPSIPGACSLFRRDACGRGVCPVHETWPTVCTDYACWRILVFAPNGERAARVMGSRHLAVDDPALEAVLAPHSPGPLTTLPGPPPSPWSSSAPGFVWCGKGGHSASS